MHRIKISRSNLENYFLADDPSQFRAKRLACKKSWHDTSPTSFALFASFAIALPALPVELPVRRDSAPFFNRDKLVGSHVCQVIMLSAGPIDINAINACCLAQAKGQH
jgi:hypothetical protein